MLTQATLLLSMFDELALTGHVMFISCVLLLLSALATAEHYAAFESAEASSVYSPAAFGASLGIFEASDRCHR